MDGKQLKRVISGVGIKQSRLAEILQTTPQNINSLFQAKDVKSGTLERIAEGLGTDMSLFYNIARSVTNNNGQVVNSSNKDIHYNSDKVIEIMNEQLKAKDRQIEALLQRLDYREERKKTD